MTETYSGYVNAGVPTQVAHQARTMVRTLIQGAVGAVVAWAASKGVDVGQYEEALTGVVWVVVTAFATWVMAQPAVNRFVERWLPFLATGVHVERAALGDTPLDGGRPVHIDQWDAAGILTEDDTPSEAQAAPPEVQPEVQPEAAPEAETTPEAEADA